MKRILLPTQELLLKLLIYNKETGLLYWQERDVLLSASQGAADRFNNLFANQEALSGYSPTGHKQTVIYNTRYYSHRLIWKLIYNEEPNEIDHIDGNPINNRLQNLRSVSPAENRRNASKRNDNQSGQTGVSYNYRQRQWIAYINDKGKRVHLGTFDAIEAAITARKKAEIRYGYHTNHGRENENVK